MNRASPFLMKFQLKRQSLDSGYILKLFLILLLELWPDVSLNYLIRSCFEELENVLALFLKLILPRFCAVWKDMAQELFYKFILMLQVYIAQDEWF